MNKRTFAIPVLGATGLCLATACSSGDPLEGAWELTSFADGQVFQDLPIYTDSGDNSYEKFGSIVIGDALQGAMVMITYADDYYGSRSETRSAVMDGTETGKRTYSIETRGSFQMSLDCEIAKNDDGDDELSCSGEQFNLQSASLTAVRFDDSDE